MRKLNLQAGFPQILADYPLVVEDDIKRALEGFFKAFGNHLILDGCGLSIVSTTYSIAAGWVVFNGEIMRVEAHDITGMSGSDFLIAESYTTTISNNPKPYADGNTYPMVVETLCRFKKKTTESSFTRYLADMKPFASKIGDLALNNSVNYVGNSVSTWTLAAGVARTSGNELVIGLSKDGQLRFKGSIGFAMTSGYVTSGWRTLLTIVEPAMIPNEEIIFSLPNGTFGSTNGQEYGYWLSLGSDGVLKIKHDAVAYDIGPLNFSPISLNL